MSFSMLFIASNDCRLLKSSFELRMEDVLFSTGLSEAEDLYVLFAK
jgi:hypothetical protein